MGNINSDGMCPLFTPLAEEGVSSVARTGQRRVLAARGDRDTWFCPGSCHLAERNCLRSRPGWRDTSSVWGGLRQSAVEIVVADLAAGFHMCGSPVTASAGVSLHQCRQAGRKAQDEHWHASHQDGHEWRGGGEVRGAHQVAGNLRPSADHQAGDR
jgi:hypothetical protein